MQIRLVAPVKPTSHSGNDVTAARWRGLLTELGHRVRVVGPQDPPGEADLLVALHARRSAAAVERFRSAHPDRPIVLALTGTDLYRDLDRSGAARRSLRLADRCVVLQPRALEALPGRVRDRTHVIRQSAVPPEDPPEPPRDHRAVVVLAHLRPVKDPLLAADAAGRLPADSIVRIRHYGAALDSDLAQRAREASASNPRYEWLGEVPRRQALRELAGSHALVLASRLEGGANVVSEAIVCGVPVLASRVAGSVGLLGEDYPGLFPVGDASALAELLRRIEDPGDELYGELVARVRARQDDHAPAREHEAWARLLAALAAEPERDGAVSGDAAGGSDPSRGR